MIRLTEREREIATLLGEGLSYSAIAIRLELSVRTVEGYAYSGSDKLPADWMPHATPLRRLCAYAISVRLKRAG